MPINLQAAMEHVNREYFGGRFHPRIRWGKKPREAVAMAEDRTRCSVCGTEFQAWFQRNPWNGTCEECEARVTAIVNGSLSASAAMAVSRIVSVVVNAVLDSATRRALSEVRCEHGKAQG